MVWKIKIEIDEIKWRPYLEIFKEYLNKKWNQY